eukprot:scaffold87334_cov51-Phaeocystis_antarctica.AAC.1
MATAIGKVFCVMPGADSINTNSMSAYLATTGSLGMTKDFVFPHTVLIARNMYSKRGNPVQGTAFVPFSSHSRQRSARKSRRRRSPQSPADAAGPGWHLGPT